MKWSYFVYLNNGSNIIKPWAKAHGFIIFEPLLNVEKWWTSNLRLWVLRQCAKDHCARWSPEGALQLPHLLCVEDTWNILCLRLKTIKPRTCIATFTCRSDLFRWFRQWMEASVPHRFSSVCLRISHGAKLLTSCNLDWAGWQVYVYMCTRNWFSPTVTE